MKLLSEKDIHFIPVSAFDDSGRVFFYEDRVFRAIYSRETAKFYREILEEEWIDGVFECGLIKTWVCSEISLPNTHLILEHTRVAFDTHPCEWTSTMTWLAAKTMIRINKKLSQYGYSLKDSHPWNMMFCLGYPIFIDFGSLVEFNSVSLTWLDEFIKYFGVSIFLSSGSFNKLSIEYRREHTVGIGINIFGNKIIKYILFKRLKDSLKNVNNTEVFFDKIDRWLEHHQPVSPKKEYWNDYNQVHQSTNPLKPTEEKQIFVHNILSQVKPNTVLDCATNKGYYSEMASRLGASVIAFDNEELCVDQCLQLAQDQGLDITPVIMNFKLPTPNYGVGLLGNDAFFRFRSEIVLVLGLIHHLCIAQNLPVFVFCDICLRYAIKGIILEFVEPEDIHVAAWNLPIPNNYSLDYIGRYFKCKFPLHKIQKISKEGVERKMIYFYS